MYHLNSFGVRGKLISIAISLSCCLSWPSLVEAQEPSSGSRAQIRQTIVLDLSRVSPADVPWDKLTALKSLRSVHVLPADLRRNEIQWLVLGKASSDSPQRLRSWLRPRSLGDLILVTHGEELRLEQLDGVRGPQQLFLIGEPNVDQLFGLIQSLPKLDEVGFHANWADNRVADMLGKLPRLHVLWLQNSRVTAEGFRHLGALVSLERLYLSATPVTDQHLENLRALKKLHTLWLNQTQISDNGLARLEPLNSLRELRLRNTRITDVGMETLAGHKSLQVLDLGSTRITDKGLKTLAPLVGLHNLALSGTRISDAGLEQLAGMENLQVLLLQDTFVTDAGLIPLKKLTKLRALDLRVSRLTDSCLQNLKDLKQLESLNLVGTKITGTGFEQLVQLHQLRELLMYTTPVTDQGLAQIARLSGLRELLVGDTRITDAGLAAVCNLSNLRVLGLMNTLITDKGLGILGNMTSLESLPLSGTKITGKGLVSLGNLSRLRQLNLASVPVADADLTHLSRLRALNGLDLDQSRVTGSGLAALAPLKHLRVLSLSGTPLTDKAIEPLKQMTWLQTVRLRDTQLSDKQLDELRTALPYTHVDPTIRWGRDDFDTRFVLRWRILNADLSHLSFSTRPGTLTITTQEGGIYSAGRDSYRNVLLTKNPLARGENFEVTTRVVSFKPTAQYQQAGILCWDDDDNYIKWGCEWHEAVHRRELTVVYETNGRPVVRSVVDPATEGNVLWLRLVKYGNTYAYASSGDGKNFKFHGEVTWGTGAPKFFGLIAVNGGSTAAGDIPASFESFAYRERPGKAAPADRYRWLVENEQDVYKEIQRLIFGRQYDDACELLGVALNKHPDSMRLHQQQYMLYSYLQRSAKMEPAIAQLRGYTEYLMRSAGNQPADSRTYVRYIQMVIDGYRKAGMEAKATQYIDALTEQAKKLKKGKPLVMASLVGQRALMLAKAGKADEARKMMDEQLKQARRDAEGGGQDVSAVLRMAYTLKDLVSVESQLGSDSLDKARTDYLEFLLEKAKQLPKESNLAGLLASEYISTATAMSRSNPKEAETLLAKLEKFMDDSKVATSTRWGRYSVSSWKRRITSLRPRIEAGKRLLALVGSPAQFPEHADAWVNSSALKATDLDGKVVLLDFFAVWCGPCISTFPHLRQWRDQYCDQGFEIIGITRYYQYDWNGDLNRIKRVGGLPPEKEKVAVTEFAKYHQLKYPLAIMKETAINQHYGVTGIPHVVLIGRNGKVRMIRVGSSPQNAQELESAIKKCLAEKSIGKNETR